PRASDRLGLAFSPSSPARRGRKRRTGAPMTRDPDPTDPARALEALQVDLVTTRIWSAEQGQKVLVIFEGRDAAGKDGTIQRLTRNLSARNTRVVALPKPTDHEK